MIIRDIPEDQLSALAAKAQAALPIAVNGRIEKAIRLMRSASVELHDDGSATVLSETDGGVTGYLVRRETCTCPDFAFQAPDGWCAHRIARALAIRCQRASAQDDVSSQPTPPVPTPPACPEAVFSITLKGTMGGQEVLLTARGQSWEEFAANVAHLQGLLDPGPVPPTHPPAVEAAPTCGVHGVQTPPQPPLRQLGLKMTGFSRVKSCPFDGRSIAQRAMVYYIM
jgi:hypothetical protein